MYLGRVECTEASSLLEVHKFHFILARKSMASRSKSQTEPKLTFTNGHNSRMGRGMCFDGFAADRERQL